MYKQKLFIYTKTLEVPQPMIGYHVGKVIPVKAFKTLKIIEILNLLHLYLLHER